jgi:hypothetical protein
MPISTSPTFFAAKHDDNIEFIKLATTIVTEDKQQLHLFAHVRTSPSHRVANIYTSTEIILDTADGKQESTYMHTPELSQKVMSLSYSIDDNSLCITRMEAKSEYKRDVYMAGHELVFMESLRYGKDGHVEFQAYDEFAEHAAYGFRPKVDIVFNFAVNGAKLETLCNQYFDEKNEEKKREIKKRIQEYKLGNTHFYEEAKAHYKELQLRDPDAASFDDIIKHGMYRSRVQLFEKDFVRNSNRPYSDDWSGVVLTLSDSMIEQKKNEYFALERLEKRPNPSRDR